MRDAIENANGVCEGEGGLVSKIKQRNLGLLLFLALALRGIGKRALALDSANQL